MGEYGEQGRRTCHDFGNGRHTAGLNLDGDAFADPPEAVFAMVGRRLIDLKTLNPALRSLSSAKKLAGDCGIVGLEQARLFEIRPFCRWLRNRLTDRVNQRFAAPAFDSRDLQRPLEPHNDLTEKMVWREQRTVTSALTLHYNKTMFILEPCALTRPLTCQRVTVCGNPDGKVDIQHERRVLPCNVFDKMRRVTQPAVVDNKHLDAALALARQMQATAPHHRQRNNSADVHP